KLDHCTVPPRHVRSRTGASAPIPRIPKVLKCRSQVFSDILRIPHSPAFIALVRYFTPPVEENGHAHRSHRGIVNHARHLRTHSSAGAKGKDRRAAVPLPQCAHL